MTKSSSEKEVSPDMFAADIFAEYKENVIPPAENESSKAEKLPNWSRQLIKAVPRKTDWKSLRRNLDPVFFSELPHRLADSLAKFLNLPNEKTLEFLFLLERIIDSAENLHSENSWWLRVGIENSEAEIILELDDVFAVWLVDAALGEKLSDDDSRIRLLTASETTILEFLSLNLAHEANLAVQAPIFKYRSLQRQVPLAIREISNSKESSMLVINWQTVHNLLPSIIKIYLAPESLQALQATENRLLDSPIHRQARIRDLQTRIKDVRMRLQLGSMELSVAELSALETEDVVLIEQNSFAVENGNLNGRAELFLGDGENAKISGGFMFEDFASIGVIEDNDSTGDKLLVKQLSPARHLQIVVESIEEDEFPVIIKESMTEGKGENLINESPEEAGIEQAGIAVENLAVTLRVELEARRLTLSEVGNLHENQILELGIRPTDTVNLVIDNQLVGRGELVSVENRLGVRIKKLLR